MKRLCCVVNAKTVDNSVLFPTRYYTMPEILQPYYTGYNMYSRRYVYQIEKNVQKIKIIIVVRQETYIYAKPLPRREPVMT